MEVVEPDSAGLHNVSKFCTGESVFFGQSLLPAIVGAHLVMMSSAHNECSQVVVPGKSLLLTGVLTFCPISILHLLVIVKIMVQVEK